MTPRSPSMGSNKWSRWREKKANGAFTGSGTRVGQVASQDRVPEQDPSSLACTAQSRSPLSAAPPY